MSTKVTVGFIAGLLLGAVGLILRTAVPSSLQPSYGERTDYNSADGTIQPLLDTPIVLQQNYRVNCGASTDPAPTDLLVPMDGGVAAYPIVAETVYVAPIVGSSVNVRVGNTSVNANLGFNIGASGRDGPGVSMDAKGPLRCQSTGAAQQVDVITGRR